MKRIKKIYYPLVFFTAIAVGFLLGGVFYSRPAVHRFDSNTISKVKLNRLIDLINNEYVDKVNTDSIVDLTVNGILEKLDPHSIYMAKNESQQEAESMRGNFVGIGINFFIDHDTLTVITPVKNGPSEKAGIKAGDRILYVDGQKIYGKKAKNEFIYSKLKGELNTIVKLNVYRKSINKKLVFNVVRNTVPIKSVDVVIMLKKKIGYIKINRFAETTYTEFKNALNQILKSGAQSLILDLRDNGGGFMDEAILVADEFLKKNSLIVFTKNKMGKIQKTFSTSAGRFEKGKIAILINENSASASEILAGAIQDNDRGLIIGRRSFGKGLVQREEMFEDGSSVRLTIARYYTPVGRSIQKSYKGGNEEYMNEFLKRYQNGEMHTKDSIKIPDTLKYKTVNGRIVYGGGGIFPDIFVPLEASQGNEIIPMLMQSGIITNYVFKEIDKRRTFFEHLTFAQLLKEINDNEYYFNQFKNLIFEKRLPLNFNKDKNYVKVHLIAEFSRQLFGDSKYYSVILTHDNMINTALKTKAFNE